MTEQELIERLRITSNMINMGEKISWGQETALMDEAADMIETLRSQLEKAREVKPLVWEKRHTWEIAKCFGDMQYCVVKVHSCNGAINWRLQRNSTVICGKMVDTFEEAKAAAQQDYQRRYNAMSQEGE